MKHIKILALLFVTSLVLSNCCKVEKVLAKKEGKWEFVGGAYQTYENDVLIEEEEVQTGDFIIFSGDEAARIEDADGNLIEEYTWEFDEKDEMLKLNSPNGNLWYEIYESKKKTQKWGYTKKNFSAPDQRYELEIDLERVD